MPKGSLRVFNVARLCPLGRVAMYSISPGPPPDAYVQEFTARVVSAPRSALRSCSVKSRGMRCTAAFGPVFWGSSADSVGRGQDSADPTRHVGCRRWSVFSGWCRPSGVQFGRCLASLADIVRGPFLPLPLVIGALCQLVPLGRATAPTRALHWRASCVVVTLCFPHGGAPSTRQASGSNQKSGPIAGQKSGPTAGSWSWLRSMRPTQAVLAAHVAARKSSPPLHWRIWGGSTTLFWFGPWDIHNAPPHRRAATFLPLEGTRWRVGRYSMACPQILLATAFHGRACYSYCSFSTGEYGQPLSSTGGRCYCYC